MMAGDRLRAPERRCAQVERHTAQLGEIDGNLSSRVRSWPDPADLGIAAKSAAIWGIPTVVPRSPGRQPLNHTRRFSFGLRNMLRHRVHSGFLHRSLLLCLQVECGFLYYPFELCMPIRL